MKYNGREVQEKYNLLENVSTSKINRTVRNQHLHEVNEIFREVASDGRALERAQERKKQSQC